MIVLSMLLAGADPAIAYPAGIAIAGGIIGLILKGNFHTDSEMRERLAALDKAHAEQLALIHQGYEDSSMLQKQAHEFQLLAMTERMDKISAERDGFIAQSTAWESAAEWNNEGRLEAQRAAAVVLDSVNVSGSLLGIVRELMSERIKPPNA